MHASVRIPLSDPDLAQVIQQAVAVELLDGPGDSKASLTVDEGLLLDVEATTLSDLRAAMNGALRLLDAAYRTAV